MDLEDGEDDDGEEDDEEKEDDGRKAAAESKSGFLLKNLKRSKAVSLESPETL